MFNKVLIEIQYLLRIKYLRFISLSNLQVILKSELDPTELLGDLEFYYKVNDSFLKQENTRGLENLLKLILNIFDKKVDS